MLLQRNDESAGTSGGRVTSCATASPFGVVSSGQGLALVAVTYPEYVIPPWTRCMLEEMFPTKGTGQDLDRGQGRDSGLDIGL